MDLNITRSMRLSGQSESAKRKELQDYFLKTYDLYEYLFDVISDDEAYYLRAEPLRHPLIFYFGHTAAFYVNKLVLGKFIQDRIDPKIESICAVGVDEMSWDDLDSRHYDWPTVDEVRSYRSQVKQLVLDVIEHMPLSLPIVKESLAWVILMGIEHERIHVETSSVIIRMLPIDRVKSSDHFLMCSQTAQAPSNQLLSISGKQVTLGKPESNDTYGWDNEYGELTLDVDDMEMSEFLVSNQEFMQFVDSGGYQTPEYWTDEGQRWLAYRKPTMPRFWFKKAEAYWQRNLTNEMPLPMDWPVEVNYLEAKAFCEWKAKQTGDNIRLPTEAEWQVLRDELPIDLLEWESAPGNINLEHFASSCPVNQFKQGDFFDIIGNVWQWTESPIDGYPGFEVHPLYDDFSTPTFDGKHNLFKGGSWISTGNEATRDSRYAFRRHFFQHAGFRYLRSPSAEVPVVPVNLFETDQEISQSLERHYGQQHPSGVNNRSSAFISLIANNSVVEAVNAITPWLSELPAHGRALDLGCSVGRGSFELAKHFDHVDGIDFTARNIQHALRLKETGQTRFALMSEGEIVDYREINVVNLGYEKLSKKLHFCQGDGLNLKPQFTGYDLIFCNLLLEHVYDPRRLLAQIHERLNPHGLLVINSNFQWQHHHEDKTKWLSGFKSKGENMIGVDGLAECLSKRYVLLNQQPLMSVSPVNARHLTVESTDISIWRLKG